MLTFHSFLIKKRKWRSWKKIPPPSPPPSPTPSSSQLYIPPGSFSRPAFSLPHWYFPKTSKGDTRRDMVLRLTNGNGVSLCSSPTPHCHMPSGETTVFVYRYFLELPPIYICVHCILGLHRCKWLVFSQGVKVGRREALCGPRIGCYRTVPRQAEWF